MWCVILQRHATEEEACFDRMWKLTKVKFTQWCCCFTVYDLHFVWFSTSGALHCRGKCIVLLLYIYTLMPCYFKFRYTEINLWSLISTYVYPSAHACFLLFLSSFFFSSPVPFLSYFCFPFLSCISFLPERLVLVSFFCNFFIISLFRSFHLTFFLSFTHCYFFFTPLFFVQSYILLFCPCFMQI